MIDKQTIDKNILFSAGGAEFFLEESLRELPGRRLVCRGIWKKQFAVAKLFLDPRNARRHWVREKKGIKALQNAGVATPELLFYGVTSEGTPVLVSSYLPDAATSLDRWERGESEYKRVLLRQLAEMVGRMHEAGLVQEDLHLENFLVSDDQIYAIDGDAVRVRQVGKPLDLKASSRNLALLFAQLPPKFDCLVEGATQRYAELRRVYTEDLLASLSVDLPDVRRRRRHKYVEKCYRSCSEFKREETPEKIIVMRRDCQGKNLSHFLENPDAFLADGVLLKDGRSTTVVRVQGDGYDWVIKRYNIKNVLHRLSRCLRSTRAWISWGNAHRLKISGIASPKAIAVLENRFGPFHSTGYYVCEFVEGQNAEAYFSAPDVTDDDRLKVGKAFACLFQQFKLLGVVHGDCKVSNFLIKHHTPWVLDLDAMREYHAGVRFEKAYQSDRARFLLNWQTQPDLQRWFDDHLP